jgi:hypothetical protein
MKRLQVDFVRAVAVAPAGRGARPAASGRARAAGLFCRHGDPLAMAATRSAGRGRACRARAGAATGGVANAASARVAGPLRAGDPRHQQRHRAAQYPLAGAARRFRKRRDSRHRPAADRTGPPPATGQGSCRGEKSSTCWLTWRRSDRPGLLPVLWSANRKSTRRIRRGRCVSCSRRCSTMERAKWRRGPPREERVNRLALLVDRLRLAAEIWLRRHGPWWLLLAVLGPGAAGPGDRRDSQAGSRSGLKNRQFSKNCGHSRRAARSRRRRPYLLRKVITGLFARLWPQRIRCGRASRPFSMRRQHIACWPPAPSTCVATMPRRRSIPCR